MRLIRNDDGDLARNGVEVRGFSHGTSVPRRGIRGDRSGCGDHGA
jgi:hypothetical protein